MKAVRFQIFTWWACCFSLLCCSCLTTQAATNPPPRAIETLGDADSLRAYLALQEQVRATQLALEKNRQETEALVARSAANVTEQIKTLTQTMSDQRTREIEAMQSTNRTLLFVVGGFVGLAFLALLLTSWLQMRALSRLADFSAQLPARAGIAGLLPGGSLISNAAAAQANTQLFGALDRIERRMQELEHSSVPAVTGPPAPHTGSEPSTPAPADHHTNGNAAAVKTNGESPGGIKPLDEISLLLAKGQSLLSLEDAAEALKCFDAVLAIDPDHAEALVKKGAALELLRRDEDALQCYDNAIAADHSLTIAYLQKGGLFNRLERYEEALVCYERALQTQDRAKA